MFPACLLLLFFLVVPSLQALQANNAHDHARRNSASPHVTTRNGEFYKSGKPFRYIGTNAYWLHQLNTDKDLEDTMNAISSYGIKVVRTWAFNDVTEIPKSGVYFQVWKNGTAVINTGEDGLIRLDKVVKAAEKAGLHLLFSLTNNWAPDATGATTPGTTTGGLGNDTATNPPPGYLSNTYGGMDVYVRQILGHEATHDEFYTNPKVVSAFKKYLDVIVPRYANSSAVLGWELANDPRCNSTIPSGTLCNPHTITNWTSDIGTHVKTLDPNHLVASGDAGFYCVDCVKLNPLNPTPVVPQPRPSGRPQRRGGGPLTKAKVLRKVQSIADKLRSKRKGTQPAKRGLSQMSNSGGTVIRGTWVPTRKPRQVQHVGPAFDGTYGVDTEDILNSPSVDFSTFQYFPDQNVYNQDQTNTGSDDFSSTVQQGLEWIQQHADTAATYGKPAAITGFGIVSLPNTNTFTPVDTTESTPLTHTAPDESQQAEAYGAWIDEAINQQITGITHYQWGQTGLTTVPDGVIQTNSGSTLPSSNGFSPNDGYATYSTAVKEVLQVGATKLQNVASDVTSGAT